MFTVFAIEFVIIMIPVRCLFMETCGDSIAVIDDLRYIMGFLRANMLHYSMG